jgi:methylenetetrahydrofolate reductase (NADPH)
VNYSPSSFSLSFEVYPPRTADGWESLTESIRELAKVDPSFISVTFGAGGTGAENSLEVLRFIRDNTATVPLAHLTCIGSTKERTEQLVRSFLAEGIRHFLALRGDLPPGTETRQSSTTMTAAQLVQQMSSLPEWPRHLSRPKSTADLGELSIAVAAFPNGHPESGPGRADIDALRAKQDAGADFAITQLFFDAEDYLRYRELAERAGITIPILPGLLPVTSLARLRRAVELSSETWPEKLARSLESAADDQSRRERGIDYTAEIAEALRDLGAPGIHLYAFNNHNIVLQTLARAGLIDDTVYAS